MRIVALGVRGSTPAPGREFTEFGGHTSCVAVYGASDTIPRLVLDAGTGLRSLPALLGGEPFQGDIVLTHLHWDHLQGLPFCSSVDRPDARVRLHIPVGSAADSPAELLSRSLSPPHFPIGPDGLLGSWEFLPLIEGPMSAWVTAARIEHKGGITYGLRISLDGVSVAYLPDHALTGVASDSAQRLVEGADVLVHDGQFLSSEQDVALAYGHATLDAAMNFADTCSVGALIITHHAPSRTDSALHALAATVTRTGGGLPVGFARQDETIEVTARCVSSPSRSDLNDLHEVVEPSKSAAFPSDGR